MPTAKSGSKATEDLQPLLLIDLARSDPTRPAQIHPDVDKAYHLCYDISRLGSLKTQNSAEKVEIAARQSRGHGTGTVGRRIYHLSALIYDLFGIDKS